MSTELVFVLSEKLSWVTEVVISIYNYASGGSPKKWKESRRRKDAVNAYIKSLMEMWSKAFDSENIMERKAVANKIRNGLALQLPEMKHLLDILKKTSKPELFREDDNNRKKLPELVI